MTAHPGFLDPAPDAGAHALHRSRDLRRGGSTSRSIAAAVRNGALVVARRGAYLAAGAPAGVVLAASAGGRLACVSVLALLGVFVAEQHAVHVHFERTASRRSGARRGEVWHWAGLLRTPHPRATMVSIVDALAQAVVCQPPRVAVASLDSALHKKVIDDDDLDEIFARVPARRRVLRRLVDERAESGTETLVRLMALALGFRVELQVTIAGVGRVDMVLDGWLVVECDSEEFHTGWLSQKRDRRRDLRLAELGMASLRPVAEDILWHPEVVIAALAGMRRAREAGFPAPA